MDILGFKNSVGSTNQDILTNLHNVLKGFSNTTRKHLSSVTDTANEGNTKFQLIPEISSFSDHIVLSIAIPGYPSTSEVIRPYLAFDTLIKFVSCICCYTLLSGFLIRGGITFGEIHHDGNMVYGQGLIDAVEMEKEAKFPRILISHSALVTLSVLKKENAQPRYNNANFNVFLDQDGGFYLNWIMYNHWFELGIISVEDYFSTLGKLAEIIRINLFQQFGNPYYKYWSWQAHYFNRGFDFLSKSINRDFKLDFDSIKIKFPTD